MGTVLGMLLCEKGIPARIWGYDRRQLEEIEKNRENRKFLPGYKLPKELEFEHDDRRIMSGADLIVSAVPCQFIRPVCLSLRWSKYQRTYASTAGEKVRLPASRSISAAARTMGWSTNTFEQPDSRWDPRMARWPTP